MARSRYSYEKRQKELARKKKKEEKRQRKQNKNQPDTDTPLDGTAAPEVVAPPEAGDPTVDETVS